MQPRYHGYRPQSEDTSMVAERVQFDSYRAMSGEEKLRALLDMCETGRSLSLAGLRLRHPRATAEELDLREACLRLGRDLARQVYGARVDELGA